MTTNDIYDFQEKCLREYNLPIGLNDAKHALENYDTIDEQIEYLRKLGQPCVGFTNGRSWEEHAGERLEKIIEDRKNKLNYDADKCWFIVNQPDLSTVDEETKLSKKKVIN